MRYYYRMARRGSAVHVVTTTRHYKGRVYKTHLLRRSFREGGKVRNETLGNLSHLPDDVIELIRRALRGETLVPAEAAFQILRSRPHGHVAAVLGTLQKLGLDRILASRPSPERDRCVALIAARVLAPGSKLATARTLNHETATSTLGEILQLDQVEADDLYAAMDWLLQRQPKIEQALAKRHLSGGALVLYDVSSSYFEGRHCRLARLGHSRDGKKGSLQIVYGLLCNAAGCPVAVEVYEGNTADPRTLTDQIQKVRRRFGLERVVFVADRGLLTSARIDQELRPIEGLDWISALRSEQVRKLAQDDGPLQRSLFDTADLAEIRHPDFPGERLIACLNPLLQAERARKREDLLRATERELDQIVAATGREQRALRGQDRIGLRVGAALNRFKVAKHFQITITETAFSYARKQDSIQAEARLDGIYVLRTSAPADVIDAAGTVRAYKGLAAVERAFRCLKTVDLHVRPIHHRLDARVRAHVLLCMLAYYVEHHMRQALAPLLFAEDDPAGAAQRRGSPVEPATPSESAERKAATKRSADDQPVHHFRGLLDHLATLTKNTVQPHSGLPAFDQLTVPTPLQRQAFERLDVPLSL
ncbi:MAG: IS1634 family transposase [Pirellulales bacterium]|nr:IS1634 family transposase [Pirellulales bacterium]